MAKPPGRFTAYQNALQAVSARTGTPLSSLIVSFGILHELTAIVPVVGVFYTSRYLGIGEQLVSTMTRAQPPSDTSPAESGWLMSKGKAWMEDGEQWAGRIGRRYGIFGFEKQLPGQLPSESNSSLNSSKIVGDVANAVVAYAVTKAIFPLRIGFSLYLSPTFSRGVVEPCRQMLLRSFRRPP